MRRSVTPSDLNKSYNKTYRIFTLHKYTVYSGHLRFLKQGLL